jgi:mRNA interferase MazF
MIMTYKPFDIVITPFPFDDISKMKYRPSLVISSEEYNKKTNSATFLMITSAKHSKVDFDYQIKYYTNTNLQDSCIIRFKTFTLDGTITKNIIGRLSKKDTKEVEKILKMIFTH